MVSNERFRLSKVLYLSCAHFTVDFYAGFLAPLLPILQVSMGMSITKTASLVTIFTLTASLLQALFGYLFDRWRGINMVALAPVLVAVTVSHFGSMNSYTSLVLLMVAGGIGIAAFHPHGAALSALESGERHGVGMSIFVTGGTFGIAVGSLVVAHLVENFGLPSIRYTVVFGLLMAILFWRKVSYERLEGRESAQKSSSNPLIGYGFLVLLGLMAMLRAFMILGFQSFVPLYLANQSVGLPTIGWVLFAFNLAGGIGGLTGGSWAERIGEKGVVFASFLLPIPMLLAFLYFGSSIAGIICFGLAGYTIFTGVPILIAISQRSFPNRVGVTSSVVMGLSWGTGAIFLIPMGKIAEQVGLYGTLWGLAWIGFPAFAVAYRVFSGKAPASNSASPAAPENWETPKNLTPSA